MEPLGQFLSEANGTPSCTRLMCFASLVAALIFGALTITGKSSSEGVGITIAFLTAAFAPKIAQKPFEKDAHELPAP